MLIGGNLIVIGLIIGFIVQGPISRGSNSTNTLENQSSNSLVSSPLDQLSSAEIALSVAKVTNLPEKTAINNQADSQAAEISMASSASGDIISKPQVVETDLKSINDLIYYTTVPGDSLSSLASRFGVTSDSITWSNNLTSATLTPGTKLTIPPVNGIVYTVKAGDTSQSLASKYGANADDIISFNNDDISGLVLGQQIVIPNGAIAKAAAPEVSSFGGAIYGYNGYDYGYCTWYVASQISVPANWGNASTWAYYARMSGWNVSSVPTPGAIAQTPYAAGGEGHVAIVVAVNGDQVQIRDMNGIAGWGRVGIGWEPISKYPNFISH